MFLLILAAFRRSNPLNPIRGAGRSMSKDLGRVEIMGIDANISH